jgi:hypothetical protein
MNELFHWEIGKIPSLRTGVWGNWGSGSSGKCLPINDEALSSNLSAAKNKTWIEKKKKDTLSTV